MILTCNYEELIALREGARVLLDEGPRESCAVAAPPESRTRVEALLPRLDGDVGIETLAEQREVQVAVDAIVECLRSQMEAVITASHPAAEGAVAAYFDFAHALSVQSRLWEVESEMVALIELVTGQPATPETAVTFVFPD